MRHLLLFCLSLLLSSAFAASPSSHPQANSQTKPFLWGVANSAFQVEGAPADSDWRRFTHTPGAIKDGSNADIATDFWNRYDEDFALAQGLGANAFRMSLAWERIEPKRGEWNEEALDHYEKIILALRARGLEPVVTIWHTALPLWVAEDGGVLAPHFIDDFSDYAAKVVERFSHGQTNVRYFLTLNEPTTYAESAYVDGGYTTGIQNNYIKFVEAIHRQADAHVAAYNKIHELPDSNDVMVGYAQDMEDFQPKNRWNPMDRLACYFSELMYNRSFIDRVAGNPDVFPAIDFLGVNYYNRNIVSFTFDGFVKTTVGSNAVSQTGQEVYPQGLEVVLKKAAKYHLPIMITENGVADPTDQLRPTYIRDHIHYLLKARDQDHIPIIGYMHWSLTDNFEWNSGLSIRYGLIEIDYANNLKRIPRPSYYVYKDLIQENH
jgi:beta-glucosidase